MITAGKLTPDLLFYFESSAYSYFSFKEIKPKKEVAKVAGGLQDSHIQMWYCLSHIEIDNAGFPTFMKTMHKNWLDPR